jgi:pilus assembly protein Flp/PilA
MLKRIMVWPVAFMGWTAQKFSRKDEVGASLVEYALLLALIAVVAIGALVFLGHSVSNTLNQVENSINSTNTTAG